MPYHPDDNHLAPPDEPKLPQNKAETGPEYTTFDDIPLERLHNPQPHPPIPCLSTELGLTLPPDTFLISAANAAMLQDVIVNKRGLGLCALYGRDKVAHWIAMIEDEVEEPGTLEDQAKKRAAERRAASKRRIGALSTPSLIRKEMAALYRETYLAEPEDMRHFTRMTYMLDCLARTVALERKLEDKGLKKAEKAGQSEA